MIGKYKITVENEFLKFEFTIKRNITIVRGNSATGKTTLIEMIDGATVEDSGINLECEKKCVVLSGEKWQRDLRDITDSIVFIDEKDRFVKSDDFARMALGSDNYFVIVTREKLSNLPYSVQEVYGIRERGKYAGLAQEYTLNEFYQIYGLHPMQPFTPDVIIAEDSNSGYDFWNAIAQKNHIVCKSAEGKNKVLRTIKDDIQMEKNCLAVVDGAAFGPELEEVLQYIKYKKKNVEIYAPESFEYLILASGMWKDSFVKDICDRNIELIMKAGAGCVVWKMTL